MRLTSVADWKLEIIDDGEAERPVNVRDDVRRVGPLVVAFLLGWLAAAFLPGRVPLP